MGKFINKLFGRKEEAEESPEMIRLKMCVDRLLGLGFISLVNLATTASDKYEDRCYALELAIFKDVCENIPSYALDTVIIIESAQCDVICRLMDTFGLAGLAAWVKKTNDTSAIRISITETTLYKKALTMVDVILPRPATSAIKDARTSYRTIVDNVRVHDTGLNLIPDEELSPNPHRVTFDQINVYNPHVPSQEETDALSRAITKSSPSRRQQPPKPNTGSSRRWSIPSRGYPVNRVSSISSGSPIHGTTTSNNDLLTGMMIQSSIDEASKPAPSVDSSPSFDLGSGSSWSTDSSSSSSFDLGSGSSWDTGSSFGSD